MQCEALNYSFIIRTVVGDPDGYKRPVITVHAANSTIPKWNCQRPFPAPLIRARNGELLQIEFKNMLRDQSRSIHFHGLHMFNNPWMDGVDMITQCPIHVGVTFIYEFNLTQTGEQDLIHEQYSYDENSDYPIILQEWYHESWQDIMTGYQSFFNSSKEFKPRYSWPPTSLLINGHGRFDCHTTNCKKASRSNFSEPTKCNETIQCIPLRESYFGECQSDRHDLDEFHCHNGKYGRLRLINAASSSPLRFWIDQHPLLIVARDSLPVKPYEKLYIAIAVGQCLDVIVRCNQNPKFKYHMFVALPENFIVGVNPDNWMNALFVYPNSTVISPPQLPPQANFNDDVLFEYKHLKPLNAENYKSQPAIKRLTYKFSVIFNTSEEATLEEWQINDKTLVSPSYAPLLQSIYFDENAGV
ncbi:unnamed protein product [Rotaria sp. Silwood1]|nr:unnamed protein product [Rotaria sp. Silwood1]CAF1619370.1 unnamed protein product [Rotaria sp. Silwood1]CAF3713008.1 unnamed protein product [Rotaria sp. Silwood1]CAF3775295.1 unnamed protein product [Rotaria sp. Silwood1]CAF3833320.1 unnamed protein product [Rotaria sp. Silwood1]